MNKVILQFLSKDDVSSMDRLCYMGRAVQKKILFYFVLPLLKYHFLPMKVIWVEFQPN